MPFRKDKDREAPRPSIPESALQEQIKRQEEYERQRQEWVNKLSAREAEIQREIEEAREKWAKRSESLNRIGYRIGKQALKGAWFIGGQLATGSKTTADTLVTGVHAVREAVHERIQEVAEGRVKPLDDDIVWDDFRPERNDNPNQEHGQTPTTA